MKPLRIILGAILLAAILCCWQSAVLLRHARSDAFRVPVFRQVASVSPSRDQIVGILADPKFRAVIHALEQRSGFETLPEPEVTTVQGLSAGHLNRGYYDQRFAFTITNR